MIPTKSSLGEFPPAELNDLYIHFSGCVTFLFLSLFFEIFFKLCVAAKKGFSVRVLRFSMRVAVRGRTQP